MQNVLKPSLARHVFFHAGSNRGLTTRVQRQEAPHAVVSRQMSPLNVSQSDSRPVFSPRASQACRCFDVPWLKLSGTT